MPAKDAQQVRWPIVTTSISGIAPEVWAEFKKRADERGLTYREAYEAAINELAIAARSGEQINWPHARGGDPESIRIHESVRSTLRSLVKDFRYRQNVVMLAAMLRWMAK